MRYTTLGSEPTNQSIVVTGATGFIGRYLLDHEPQAIGITRSASYGHERIEVSDYSHDALARVFLRKNAVIHLAGMRTERGNNSQTLEHFLVANSVLTETVAKAAVAAKVGTLVVVSTTACYSERNRRPFLEDHAPAPLNNYGLSKLVAEHAAEIVTGSSATRLVVLRLASVYGHGEKLSPAIMTMIDKASRGEVIELRGNRNAMIDAIYVRDALAAIRLAMLRQDTKNIVFNIGSGQAISIFDVAATIAKVFDQRAGIKDSSVEGPRQDENYMDISRAKNELGWHPQYSLTEGVRDFRTTMEGLQV
jgi:UDP-glucose 4-epimerase